MAEQVTQKIFVGNLPFAASETDIKDFFKLPADAIVDIPVFRHNSSKKLGFAFLTVDPLLVTKTLELDGEELMGRVLRIAMAKAKDQSKPSTSSSGGRFQRKRLKGKASSNPDGVKVMQARPRRAIPQSELDKLVEMRKQMAKLKVADDDNDDKPAKSASVNRLNLIDVGANLTNYRYIRCLEPVISRAMAAGVDKIIVTGTSVEDSQQAIILAESLPGVLYCTVGVHPHQAKNWLSEEGKALLQSLVEHPQVVAVGECGLDYHRMLSSTDKQLEAFEDQVEVACATKKPLFVHDRSATEAVQSILARYRDRLPPTVIHCFMGTQREAEEYLKLGCYIGITGSVCMKKRGEHLREMLREKAIPIERLVIETDCPFMTPEIPRTDDDDDRFGGQLDFTEVKRTRNNEPCTLPLVADMVAKCYGISTTEVADRTTQNANTIFNLA